MVLNQVNHHTIASTGIYSYDHKDIHTGYDENRRKMGLVEKNKKLIWNGIPVEQLPPELKTAIGAQIRHLWMKCLVRCCTT